MLIRRLTLIFIHFFFNHVVIKHLLGLFCVPGDPDTATYECQRKESATLVCFDKPMRKTSLWYLVSGSLWGAVESQGKYCSPPALVLHLGSLSVEATIFPQSVTCCHLLRSDQLGEDARVLSILPSFQRRLPGSYWSSLTLGRG